MWQQLIRKKVLVVDNDPAAILLVKIALDFHGYDVLIHDNGLNVAEIIEVHEPDLLLLDVRLKGISGTDICKELKKTIDIPIILFSAHVKLENTYKDYDADAFLSKPYNVVDLIDIIRRQLRLRA